MATALADFPRTKEAILAALSSGQIKPSELPRIGTQLGLTKGENARAYLAGSLEAKAELIATAFIEYDSQNTRQAPPPPPPPAQAYEEPVVVRTPVYSRDEAINREIAETVTSIYAEQAKMYKELREVKGKLDLLITIVALGHADSLGMPINDYLNVMQNNVKGLEETLRALK